MSYAEKPRSRSSPQKTLKDFKKTKSLLRGKKFKLRKIASTLSANFFSKILIFLSYYSQYK
ncbi:hypothetical protein PACTADRAFT_49239 [Pachysolen tannophilus NRRL Y-2460]|uniref:Uncharacterized protein n=1 Tax=Pachysolen tannophilus NRRL Y-2460 TaxID=669874 RepID=A0A1E4TVK2_PACTA|nr:hypothetical protein PACTADRAFT_49239 [Pachysolen tannophilus NRRL Y-2460]